MRAEAAGDPRPWRQQAILERGRWQADVVRDCALETLADPDAVLMLDETGFLKQGEGSCGIGRQYTGSAGKITNCQIGVFAAYASRHGHAFIDRALYLPKAWNSDSTRLAAAHTPEGTSFATKPGLARWRRSRGRWLPACRSPGWQPRAIDDSFEAAKNELGLDHNETRSWHGWHRPSPWSCWPSPC